MKSKTTSRFNFVQVRCLIVLTLNLLFSLKVNAQPTADFKEKYPTFFALEFRPIIANSYFGTTSLSLVNDTFSATLRQNYGYSLGGMIRRSYTDQLSVETGINYVIRNFDVQVSVPDSNIYGTNDFSFTSFELPLKGLVFIKLSEAWYSNVGLGLAGVYKASNVGVLTNPGGKHQFGTAGIVERKFSLDVRAQFGFEYRTKRKGYYYLGGSASVGTSNMFIFLAAYGYDNKKSFQAASVKPGYFSIDLRYYFYNVKNKGEQPNLNPLE